MWVMRLLLILIIIIFKLSPEPQPLFLYVIYVYICKMENIKLYVGVHVEIKDGKAYISIEAAKGMALSEMQSVLVGGLNLAIRGEKTPELQGKRLKEIISIMESELIDINSFDDAEFKTK